MKKDSLGHMFSVGEVDEIPNVAYYTLFCICTLATDRWLARKYTSCKLKALREWIEGLTTTTIQMS
jgi:hypothetical protein